MYEYSAYFNSIEKELFFDPNGVHGITHTKRVMLLALFLMRYLNIEDKSDIILVLVAALYHDIGRTHNRVDYNHGILSWKKLMQIEVSKLREVDPNDLELAKLLIENHCRLVEFHTLVDEYNINDINRAKLLFNVLRDCDILDRIRIGNLDSLQLYFNKSKELILLAKHLVYKHT